MPTWPQQTKARLKQLSDDHKDNLRSVADAFASFEGVDSVSLKHVNDAHVALAQIGLRSRPWYRRTEFETGIGGLFCTVGAAAPDLASTFLDSGAPWYRGVVCGTVSALVLFGLLLIIHAWFRGRIPTGAK